MFNYDLHYDLPDHGELDRATTFHCWAANEDIALLFI